MTASDQMAPRVRGAVKFVLLHHEGCPRTDFHYAIAPDGRLERLLDEGAFAQHPGAIAVLVRGRFDDVPPPSVQLEALQQLLVDLVLRFPAATVGAHRQVRGEVKTTCPGRRFPMRELAAWCRDGLPKARDARIGQSVEEQYSKI